MPPETDPKVAPSTETKTPAPAVDPASAAATPAAVTAASPASAPAATGTEAKPAAATESSSLLAEAPKVADKAKDAQSAEAKAPDAKPADAKASDTPLTYTDFALPEGITLDKTEVGAFTEILGKYKAPQEFGQELVNFYVDQSQKEIARLAEASRNQWSKINEEWINSVKADPELGGNRSETVLQSTRQLVEQFGGTAEQKKELRAMLSMTGAGNHPSMVRFLYRVANALGEGRPVPAQTQSSPDAGQRSSAQKRYGGPVKATAT